jgi:hypothetical protein
VNAPDPPPRASTIVEFFANAGDDESQVDEYEDQWTNLPRPSPPIRMMTGIHTVQTHPDSLYGPSEFFETRTSIVSIPKGALVESLSNCLITFTMGKRREVLCNVELWRDIQSESIRFIPERKNASVLKYTCKSCCVNVAYSSGQLQRLMTDRFRVLNPTVCQAANTNQNTHIEYWSKKRHFSTRTRPFKQSKTLSIASLMPQVSAYVCDQSLRIQWPRDSKNLCLRSG